MDQASVAEAIRIRPAAMVDLTWSEDGKTLFIAPGPRWLTDQRYLVEIGANASTSDGHRLEQPLSYSFTTQTAPVVAGFELRLGPDEDQNDTDGRRSARQDPVFDAGLTQRTTLAATPAPKPVHDTVRRVSSETRITLTFSTPMRHADVERHFVITPRIRGELSWRGESLVFTPSERLDPQSRYALTVAGAHDVLGNELGGDASFSFTTVGAAHVLRSDPRGGERSVRGSRITIWFSRAMDRKATAAGLVVRNATTDRSVPGTVRWNRDGTRLTFAANSRWARGSLFVVRLQRHARDADGNPVRDAWRFRGMPRPEREPAPVVATASSAPAPVVRTVSGPPAPADMQQYALWQVNQARAQYGLRPMVLDAGISQVAADHAWDMLRNGYFSHTGLDGSTISERLRRGGVSFSWSGENICYQATGGGVRAALDWCHRTFMSEPYPGFANHIGNILSTHFTRLGVGIATSGAKVIVVWDFAG